MWANEYKGNQWSILGDASTLYVMGFCIDARYAWMYKNQSNWPWSREVHKLKIMMCIWWLQGGRSRLLFVCFRKPTNWTEVLNNDLLTLRLRSISRHILFTKRWRFFMGAKNPQESVQKGKNVKERNRNYDATCSDKKMQGHSLKWPLMSRQNIQDWQIDIRLDIIMECMQGIQ